MRYFNSRFEEPTQKSQSSLKKYAKKVILKKK